VGYVKPVKSVDSHDPTTRVTQSRGTVVARMTDMEMIKGIVMALLLCLSFIGVGLLLQLLS
jgi:hypothetical protein